MPASYPTSVKTFVSKVDGVDYPQAAHVNDLQDEVNAIESGLLTGTARLNSSNSTMVNLSVTGGATFASLTLGATTLTSLVVSGGTTVGTLQAGASSHTSLVVSGGTTLGTVSAGASTVTTFSAGASTLASVSIAGGSTFGTVQAGASTVTTFSAGASTVTTFSAGASTLASLSIAGGSTIGTLQAGASTHTNLSVSGGSTFASRLNLNGVLQLESTSITLSTGDTHNLAVSTTASIVRLTGNSSGSTLTGFSRGQAAGELLIVFNVGNTPIIFGHNTGSIAANRFGLAGGVNSSVQSAAGAFLIYDGVNSLWRMGSL